ncbi:hypothetical protein GCK72_004237 [Caenorhabditis remanei]|uniref:Uncharacterized protein n=1 Tax=Caenorhabditis remanei TaxID=31234 RepID=A0A6A5H8Z1_CAERE|nr:hypothetical protein GCK72_004237 [Caenorhabditis remanei]KAF1764290.1 hypothetical protein GCK72_004237 [Caenorhabditis remanei]
MNTSCASQDILDRLSGFNLKLSQAIDLLAISLTFFATYSAIKVISTQSIFQVSTKILVFQILIYANLHQVSYGIEAIGLLYRSLFMLADPCNLLQSDTHCAPYLEVLMCGISGMVYGQTGLLIERGFATFSKCYGSKKRLIIGAIISFIVMICSLSTGRLLLWDDPLNGHVIGCFAFPKNSSVRSGYYFLVCTVLTLLNLIVSIWIMRYNKRCEYETRFKVGARFQKREVIESTGAICFLTLSQFIFMFLYSFGIYTLKFIRDSIHPQTFYFWIVWCYTMPFIALMFPVLLIYLIRRTRARRALKIVGITNRKQTQDDHITEMKSMWT